MKKVIVLFACIVLAAGCVSTKKYKRQTAKADSLKIENEKLAVQLAACLDEQGNNATKVKALQQEVAQLKNNGNALLKQLSDLSVLSATQSESIKKSLDNISSKDAYIKDLNDAIRRKDSLNMQLVLNLKGALKDVNDTDINIKVEGSAVFISISDKMLFSSGSYIISHNARAVLGKVADVIKAQPDMQFMVEGHTDNKRMNNGFIKDNWDLSVMRAAAVVRTLQRDYGVEPGRMIAAGRSEYVTIADNATAEGRSLNRRTRIVILPQLDQFFKLLEAK